MHWPQITILCLTALSLLVTLAKHGEKQTGTHNFAHFLLGQILVTWLLWMGGFFS